MKGCLPAFQQVPVLLVFYFCAQIDDHDSRIQTFDLGRSYDIILALTSRHCHLFGKHAGTKEESVRLFGLGRIRRAACQHDVQRVIPLFTLLFFDDEFIDFLDEGWKMISEIDLQLKNELEKLSKSRDFLINIFSLCREEKIK